MTAEPHNPNDPVENLAIGTIIEVDGSHVVAELKPGIWYVAKRFPNVPVIPIFINGLGRSMPKGSLVPIPFFINIAIGKQIFGDQERTVFMASLKERFRGLKLKSSPAYENAIETTIKINTENKSE